MPQLDYTLFQDPGVQYPDGDIHLSFADYIAQCRALIEKTRPDIKHAPNPDLIIEANSPFELKPAQSTAKKIPYGALLIHGLLDSPSVMRDIGTVLQNQGMLVRAVLLPGHGTVPGALLNVTYQDWLRTLHYGIASFAQDVEQVVLVGFSTGGTLALYQALQQTHNNVAGLALLAPAIKINSTFDFTSDWYRAISWAWKRAKWMHIAEENDYAKYQSMPFNAIYQVYQLTKEIKKFSKNTAVNHPLLIAASQDDTTVSSKATIHYFQQHSRNNSQLIIYSNQSAKSNDSRIIFRPASYPQWNILAMSHIAIPIAPTNPHYGIHGDYKDASHVEENNQKGEKYVYGPFNGLQNAIYNFFYRLGILKQKHIRLSFNPDFDFLAKSICQFFKKLSAS